MICFLELGNAYRSPQGTSLFTIFRNRGFVETGRSLNKGIIMTQFQKWGFSYGTAFLIFLCCQFDLLLWWFFFIWWLFILIWHKFVLLCQEYLISKLSTDCGSIMAGSQMRSQGLGVVFFDLKNIIYIWPDGTPVFKLGGIIEMLQDICDK